MRSTLSRDGLSRVEGGSHLIDRVRKVILSADDFGLSPEINEAVEIAHTKGLLSTASLMVAGAAASDAVARARRLPNLRVGLHLVVIEGPASSPGPNIKLLLGPDGEFPSNQLALGLRYFFNPAIRRQLAREIEAQFDAFAGTGLRLDHANAHKHMHLHPTVGRLMIETGRKYGLGAIRIPFEPPGPLTAVDATRDTRAAALLRHWTGLLRRNARQAGLRTNDSCFGLAWTGAMKIERVEKLAPNLPSGLNEIYFHPATAQTKLLARRMPRYAHQDELAALCAPALREALDRAGVTQVGWDDAPVQPARSESRF